MSFRTRRRSLRSKLGSVIAIIALIFAARSCNLSDNELLDLTTTSVRSGEYRLVQVLDSGRIEVIQYNRPRESFGLKLLGIELQDVNHAVTAIRDITGGYQVVRVRFDRRRVTDDTRELQAYVFAGDICLNTELARRGLATEDTHPSDAGPMIRGIKQAEQEARTHRRGIWNQKL